MKIKSWISPKTEKGLPSKIIGRGFFAREQIKKGELLAVKTGHVISGQEVLDNSEVIQGSETQIWDDLFLAPMTSDELEFSMIFYNHCCEPNMGVKGSVMHVALKDIQPSEELTVDYATIFDRENYSFDCSCGVVTCRGVVTGKDWQKEDLQEKYKGYFSAFLEEKINSRVRVAE
jgi:hypothetical protein